MEDETQEPLVFIDDKAPQLQLNKDGVTITGDRGYRMARASVGVSEGSWFFECKIKGQGHYRVGWATRQAELQAPVGFDKFSFGYGDLASKLHESNRQPYGETYSEGDVVGSLLAFAHVNTVRFFRNGVDQGVAFEVPNALYYPAFSLYGDSQLTANFGPPWAFEPTFEFKPLTLLGGQQQRRQPKRRDDSSSGREGSRSSKRTRAAAAAQAAAAAVSSA